MKLALVAIAALIVGLAGSAISPGVGALCALIAGLAATFGLAGKK